MGYHIKNKIFIMALLLGLISALFTGCGSSGRYQPVIGQEVLDGYQTQEGNISFTDKDLALESMELVAEDEFSKLYFGAKTAEIAIVLKSTGAVWRSNPEDRIGSKDTLLWSQLYVTAMDDSDNLKKWDSFNDSVNYGQFKTEKLQNGIRVTYLFGKKTKSTLFPAAFTKERFEEIIGAIEKEADKNYMKRMFVSTEYAKISSKQAQDTLRANYTDIERLGLIYAVKASTSVLEEKNLTRILEGIGYTYEQKDKDNQLVSYTGGTKRWVGVQASIEYLLKDGALSVTVPAEKVMASERLKITGFGVLNSFGAEKYGNGGFVLVPDGSGAVISSDIIKAATWPEYSKPVYGADYGLLIKDRLSMEKNIYFPVFGTSSSSGGVLGIVEKGAGLTEIKADAPRSREDYACAYPFFKTLSYTQVSIESKAENTVNLYPDKGVIKDMSVIYKFVDGRNPGYDVLAAEYRNYLEGAGMLSQNKGFKKNALAVNLIGAIRDARTVMGVPSEAVEPLTDFGQAYDIAEELRSMTDGNIMLQYTGWKKGGIKTGVSDKYDAEEKLGGNKGFVGLTEALRELGVELVPSVEPQYSYVDSALDGFNKLRDSIRFITNDAGYKPDHNIANYYLERRGLNPSILKPGYAAGVADAFIKDYIDGKSTGYLSLSAMGEELYSDFSSKSLTSRDETAEIFKGIMKAVKDNGLKLAVKGSNQYALEYMDYAFDIPFSSDPNPLFDKSVPFAQIVLSGSIGYTAPPANYEPDMAVYLLKAVETGSTVYFDCFADSNHEIKDTKYNRYYNCEYSKISSLIKEASAFVEKASEAAAQSRIKSHYQLSDNIFATEYENGKIIVVNYNKADSRTELGDVPALGYAVFDR